MIHWLYVNVVGNLTASAIWASPVLLHLHLKLNRQHDQILNGLQGRQSADKVGS